MAYSGGGTLTFQKLLAGSENYFLLGHEVETAHVREIQQGIKPFHVFGNRESLGTQ